MADTLKIDLWNGEEIRIEPDGQAELYRDGELVAAPRFATPTAARHWANALVDRAARSSPRVLCVGCDA